MFEWKRHSQEHTDVPDCSELLAFIDLRAQAAEATVLDKRSKGNHPPPNKAKPLPALAASTKETGGSCIACKGEKHPLYSCSKFRSMSHDEMTSLLRQYGHCLNCLRHGHFVKDCKSLHHCKVCQRPHHLLLHIDKPRPEQTDTPVHYGCGYNSVKATERWIDCYTRSTAPVKIKCLLTVLHEHLSCIGRSR